MGFTASYLNGRVRSNVLASSLALFTNHPLVNSGSELSGNGYSRVQLSGTNMSAAVTAPTANSPQGKLVIKNKQVLQFPAATGLWPKIRFYALIRQSVVIWYAPVPAPLPIIAAGERLRFEANRFVIDVREA